MSETVTVEVEMRAFMDCTACGARERFHTEGGPCARFVPAIRPVDIPAEVFAGPVEGVLEAVFYYGQNDFQPKPFCSVSVGDVVRLDGNGYRVGPVGFEPAAAL